jgi:hypothetical protein
MASVGPVTVSLRRSIIPTPIVEVKIAIHYIAFSGLCQSEARVPQGESIYFELKGEGKRTTRKDFRKKCRSA